MLKITKENNSLFVEAELHEQFPYEGLLSLPLNSIIVQTDESDVAVFRSASNYDIMFSGKISDITIDGKAVTKETIAEAFGEISNVPQGGGEGGTTDYNKLSNKPSINGLTLQGSVELPIPTKTSELTNDSGFVDASIVDGYAKSADIADEYQPKGNYATKDEIPSLDGYATETWVEDKHYLTEHQDISGKQDVIADLETIREGAAKGATAIQEHQSLADYAKTADVEATYQPKGDYATKDEIPSLDGYATEAWVEGKHYLTEHQDISGKQDVISDLETIREGAALGATAIQEHQDISGKLDKTEAAETYQPKGDYLTSETDPIYTADKPNLALKSEIPSLEGYATEEWVEGKGYLTEHQDISGKLDKTEAAETYQVKGNYATKDEIPSLDGYATEEWVEGKHYLTEHQDISGKQDVITDLETIREGAAKGATAIQEHQSLEGYATEAWVNEQGFLTQHQDISGKADKDSVYTKEESDAKYLTEHQDISGKLDKTEAAETYQPKGDYLTEETDPVYTADKPNIALKSEIPSLDGYATEAWVGEQGYLTEHQPLKTINGETIVGDGDITIEGGDSDKYYIQVENVPNNTSTQGKISISLYKNGVNITNETVAPQWKVMTHGVTNRSETIPTIRSYTTQIQIYYTIYSVSTVEVFFYPQNLYVHVPLNEYFNFQQKQDVLESGTNIKTINGESILGEGNIVIQGGGGDETDPIFTASPAYGITAEDITAWNDKSKPYIPTHVSELVNDMGYLTEHQSLEAYATKDDVEDALGDYVGAEAFGQHLDEQAQVDANQNTLIEGLEGSKVDNDTFNTAISRIDTKINDIELFKFPNATIVGEPVIQSGQVSGFSNTNYLQFPFIMDLHNKPFQIDFVFTTGADVTTQQNVLDSKFGMAVAIKEGKGLMAISSDGQSWNVGNVQGTMAIEANTTYYAQLTWDGAQYKTLLSTDGTTYAEDMVLAGTERPYPTTIYIGGCDLPETLHTPHPFLGSINLNKAHLRVNGTIVWDGMDDVGLASRLATDMNNIDAAGIRKVKEIVAQDTIDLTVTLEDGSIVNYILYGKEVIL